MTFRTFTYPIKILEHHLDAYGHVNNVAYIGFFEQARWDMVTAEGCGLEYVKHAGVGLVVLELNCKFRRELRLRQDVVIHSRLQSWRGKIGVMSQIIKDASNENFCEAQVTFGLFDLNLRKLVAPNEQWGAALGI
jgi:acyl-CoA thioester hydrolase